MSQQSIIVKDFNSKQDFNEFDEKLDWNKSAKWSFSRLQLGRREADRQVNTQKQLLINALPLPDLAVLNNPDANKIEVAAIMKPIIVDAVDTVFGRAWDVPLRPLQYIINQKKNSITTVCTRNHNLIDPQLVGDTVKDVLKEAGFNLSDTLHKKYMGVVGTNKTLNTPFGELKVGLSIGFGRWDTTRAIMAGIYFELTICTNPLSFLEVSNTMNTKLGLYNQKVLRLGNPEDILARTRKVISTAAEQFTVDSMPPIMIANGKYELAQKDATAVVNAMGNAYQVGKKIRTEVIDSYNNKTHTIWNLAMIMSKIATDGDNFRKDAVRTPAKLSAMALVLLTTTEIPKVITNSYAYCDEHGIEIPA